MSLFTDASLVVKPSLYKTSKLYSIKPGTGLGDLSVVRNGVKWGFGPNGVLRQVAANVPLIEYNPVTRAELGLLVEPGMVNQIVRSSEFSNASWSKTDLTVTADNLLAPDGTTTGDTLTEGVAGTAAMTQGYTVTSGATVTQSVFLKYNNQQWLRLRIVDGANAINAWVDIQNGVAGTISAAGTGVIGTVVVTNVGNGWYRCSMSGSIPATTSYSFHLFSAASNGSFSRTNNAAYGVWHAQAEMSAVATSIMPTTSGTFTRVADVVSLTGASSLIGATEGTLYAEVNIRTLGTEGYVARVGFTTFNDTVAITRTSTNNIGAIVRANGNSIFNQSSSGLGTGVFKVALAYSANSHALYVNGVSVATGTTALSFASTLDNIRIGSFNDSTALLNDVVRAFALFPTRKSNAELAAMTTL